MGNQEIKGNLGQGQGYRVISIQENSPCYNQGISFFTDFIVDVEPSNKNNQSTEISELDLDKDGQYIVDEKKDFFAIVNQNENKPLNMILYNVLKRNFRKVQIVPNKQWSQQGNLLGVMLRLENYLHSHDNTFKIITVDENSPAQNSGLIEKNDYIIGLKKYKYEDLDELINIIVDNEGQEVELVVYNLLEKQVKNVILKPQLNWGGRGLIGCEFAGGYLNQLPQIIDEDAEQIKKNQQQKMIEKLSMLIHRDEQQNEVILSPDPPPTDVFMQQDATQQINQHQVAHTHHKIIQSIKNIKKPSNDQEVTHNTDPFSFSKSSRKSSNSNVDYESLAQPQDKIIMDRRKSTDNTSYQNNQNENDQQEQNRQVSYSLPHQIASQNNQNNQKAAPSYFETYKADTQSSTPKQQQQTNTANNQQLEQLRRNSITGNRKYEYDCQNLQSQKYVIQERDLFNLNIKLQPNTLLFQHEYKL